MPPRKTRSSLPTPADSAKSAETPSTSSAASTPAVSASGRGNKASAQAGLPTPDSMTDGDDAGTEVDEEEVKPKNVRGRKRKVESETESVFSASAAGTNSKGDSGSLKSTIDSVAIPGRRSKLGQEQTGSADNLTLGSSGPAGKKPRPSAVAKLGELEGEDGGERKVFDEFGLEVIPSAPTPAPVAKGKKDKHAAQPFNIGKYSRVAKASASELALSDDDTPTIPNPAAARGRPRASAASSTTKPKAQPKGRGKPKKAEASDESEVPPAAADDFAMDSDEEERQLKAAIRASAARGVTDKFGSASTTEVNSRASSAMPSTGRKGAGAAGRSTAPSTPSTGRKSRVAAIKSAEKVKKAIKLSRSEQDGSDDEFGSDFGGSGSGTGSDASSALSSEEEDSDDPISIGPGSGKSKSKSKSKAKAKAAPKTRGGKTRKFAGKGRKLGDSTPGSGSEVEDESMAEEDLDALDDETREMTIQKMKEGKAAKRAEEKEKMKPIRKAEAALKKELGRKLTNGEKNSIRLVLHHPELRDVWGDLQQNVVPIKPVMMEAHPSLKLNLLPFQKESLYWMKEQEKGVWKGGMLADEMGMGKTIQTIALLLSEPRRKPSLVVAPVVALMQWKHEIENNTDGFTVCVWHGQGRMKAAELKKYDVVLCSYGTLEASFRRQARGFKKGDVFIKEQSPMHTFEWYRVILDEAHNIKERSTNAAKAAFALQAQYKWCLSGTPLQNRVGELYSLVRFLGADPFSHYFCKKCDCKSLHWKFTDKRTCDQCGHGPMSHVCFWNTEILTPIARYGIETGGPGHTAFKKLKVLLDRMMLRRTKLERADDLGLPPRTIVVRRDYFSPEEKELYMSLFTGAKRQFATYVGQGTVLNNYSNIFSLITRMRQMACHPDLVLRSKTAMLKDMETTAEGTVCRLCQDTAEDAIVSACRHVFDRECIRQYLEVQQNRGHRPECPVCHIEISIDLEQEAVDVEENSKKARQGILSRLDLNNWRSSSKLEALVEELEKLRNKDCTIKSLVFSQFVSFLDLIAFRLQKAGFNICRLEGGMTPQQRDATIQHFMNNTHVTVFLISLKAGGVALNLTEASMVFMMDSWWNPSVEYQAMDRIHRLGQKRPVKVVKLVVEDSIEDQIVQLQHKKLAMTEAALNKDPDAALGKLTVEDLGFLFKM